MHARITSRPVMPAPSSDPYPSAKGKHPSGLRSTSRHAWIALYFFTCCVRPGDDQPLGESAPAAV